MYQLDAALIVEVAPVVTVGEVERIDIPRAGVIAFVDHVECQLVGGRNARAAGFSQVKERVFVHFPRLGVMGNEYDLNVGVGGAKKADHPEVEAARDVLFELTHRSGHIAHGDDDRVVVFDDGWFPGAEAQVVVGQSAESRFA